MVILILNTNSIFFWEHSTTEKNKTTWKLPPSEICFNAFDYSLQSIFNVFETIYFFLFLNLTRFDILIVYNSREVLVFCTDYAYIIVYIYCTSVRSRDSPTRWQEAIRRDRTSTRLVTAPRGCRESAIVPNNSNNIILESPTHRITYTDDKSLTFGDNQAYMRRFRARPFFVFFTI